MKKLLFGKVNLSCNISFSMIHNDYICKKNIAYPLYLIKVNGLSSQRD